MVTIEVRIGLWHDCAALVFDTHARAKLTEWIGDRLDLTVHGRELRLAPGDTMGIQRCNSDKNAGDGFRITTKGVFAPTAARCELHPIKLSFEGMFPWFDGELAPDHMTPWPRLRRKCRSYYTPDVMVEQILMRRRSAVGHGLRCSAVSIPDHWLETLDEGHRRDLFNRSVREFGA